MRELYRAGEYVGLLETCKDEWWLRLVDWAEVNIDPSPWKKIGD